MLHHDRPIKLKREISVLQALRPINRANVDTSHASGFVLPMVITGGFILIDESTNETVAAGMITN